MFLSSCCTLNRVSFNFDTLNTHTCTHTQNFEFPAVLNAKCNRSDFAVRKEMGIEKTPQKGFQEKEFILKGSRLIRIQQKWII